MDVVLTNRADVTCDDWQEPHRAFSHLKGLFLQVFTDKTDLTPGTYVIAGAGVGREVPPSGALAGFWTTKPTCELERQENASEGTITITRITDGSVDGSFDVVFGTKGRLQGSFKVPFCAPLGRGRGTAVSSSGAGVSCTP